ncbi:LOW QUALITY PROTEIN: bifunctional epoxide hydrolase 2-like [Sarcophilus harrisii]
MAGLQRARSSYSDGAARGSVRPRRSAGASLSERHLQPDRGRLGPAQFLHQHVVRLIAIQPSNVAHGYVEVKPGVQLHFVEMGSGPVVLLCHGFPESFSWRYQIPALAEAGYRVIVPDMKGYGDSSAPYEIEEYSQKVICKEMITFLDKLGSGQFEFTLPSSRPSCAFYTEDKILPSLSLPALLPRTRILKKSENPPRSWMVTEEEIEFYVQQFKKSGFRGPLNWYRNLDANWRWGCTGVRRKILIPALIVIAEKDMLLLPEFSKNMEKWIPNLKRRNIENCGQWIQIEKPKEVNQILIEWLKDVAKNPVELYALMLKDCRKLSAASGFCLPEQFSIEKMFEEMISKGKINYPILQAAITLKNKGYKTCILTNKWLDDSPHRHTIAQVAGTLEKHFDLMIESCRTGMAKPDPEIYKFALETLKVTPHEVS